MAKEIVSIIDVGTSSIKMSIYQITDDKYSVLEELRHPIRLGKDSFYDGLIDRSTIDESVVILKKFKKLCKEYNVTNIRTIATTAVREASNVDIFLDNIRIMTDLDIEIITPNKETEYIHNSLINKNELKEYNKYKYRSIVKIGTGTVEIAVIEDDCIIFTRSLPLGILKLKQIFVKDFHSEENFNNFLEVITRHELENLKRNIPKVKIDIIYGIGFEITELSNIINKSQEKIQKITKKSIENLYTKIEDYSEEELIHKLKIPYDISETFYPACLVFVKLINLFDCDNIIITDISLRDGMLQHMYFRENNEKYFSKLEKQLKINALSFGRSLNFDEKHALKVTDIALKIFDQTIDIHHLSRKERSYLLLASILHDIGLTLSYRIHHKHSLYMIKAQEFFSMNDTEVNIVANIARYHRKSGPRKSHIEYMALTLKDRMTVLKLASILRIADSLDNSHLQLFNDIEITKKENEIIINATISNQFYSEIYAFNYKKKLFEDFFGINVKLRIQ